MDYLVAREVPLWKDAENLTGPLTVWQEIYRCFSLAVPNSISEMLGYGSYIITTAQVSRIGSLELSGMMLGRSIFHVTGLSIVIGMASTIETFGGQAFGAQQYSKVGIYFQRGLILSLLTSIIPIFLWIRADFLMVHVFRQDPQVSRLACDFLAFAPHSLVVCACNVCLRAYLSCQGHVLPLIMIAMLLIIVSPISNTYFIHTLGFGLRGASLSFLILSVIEMFGLLLAAVHLHYCLQLPSTRTWRGLNRQCLKRWKNYLSLSLPTTGSICVEWWTYEAMILISGSLPNANLMVGVMGLLFEAHSLIYMTATGFGAAASTRVSNELGAGEPQLAARAAAVAVAMGTIVATSVAVIMLLSRKQWLMLFTNDAAVLNAAISLMPLLTFSNIFDSAAVVGGWVLHGAGRQAVTMMSNILSYWILGLPAAVIMAMRYDMGARGLWIALTIACIMQSCVLMTYQSRFDWSKEVGLARQRNEAEEEERLLLEEEEMGEEGLEGGLREGEGEGNRNEKKELREGGGEP